MRIVVIGAGIMGSGICQVLAEAGIDVVVADEVFKTNQKFLENAKSNIMRGLFYRKNSEKKYVYDSRESLLEIFKKIEWVEPDSVRFKACLANSDAAIEAIFENIEVKKNLYRTLETYMTPTAPIFTNTSVIKISSLAVDLKNKDRFMGMHFFNPVPLMKPVELITYNNFASVKTMSFAQNLVKKLGKEICLAPDRIGFVSNGIFVPMTMAAAEDFSLGTNIKEMDKSFTSGTWQNHAAAKRIIEVMIQTAKDIVAEGSIGKEDLDRIIRLGFNMPFGPFEIEKKIAEGTAGDVKFPMGPAMLMDHVGIDVALDCCKMFKLQEPDKWKVPEMLEQMTAAGKRGKKSGEGFYKTQKGEVKCELLFLPDTQKGTYAMIWWTGKALSLEIIKELKQKFIFAKASGAKSVLLNINKARGADVTEFALCLCDDKEGRLAINEWHGLIKEIMNFPGPVICALEGMALGGGYELALACDYIVAGKGADYHVTGNIMQYSAIKKREREAVKYSFRDNFMAKLEIWKAKQFWLSEKKEQPPESFSLAVRSIWDGNLKSLDDGLAEEMNAIVTSFNTPTAQRKIRAFLSGERMINLPKGTSVGLPEMTLGILPGGGGTQNLTRRVGLMLALRMILRGNIIIAEPPYVDEVINAE